MFGAFVSYVLLSARIDSLARSSDVQAIRELGRYLTSPDVRLRLPAAQAISVCYKRQGREANARVEAVLASPDKEPRVLRSLLSDLQASVNRQEQAVSYFASFSPEMVVRIANQRFSRDPAVRKRLIEDVVPLYFSRDSDYEIDEWYARMCPILQDSKVSLIRDLCVADPHLAISLMSQSNYRYRAGVLECLVGERAPEVAAAMIERTHDKFSEVREAAVRGLAGCKGVQVRRALVVAWQDKYAFVRYAAHLAMMDSSVAMP